MRQPGPIMVPAPGERLLRFVGDRIRFVLRTTDGRPPLAGWRARLRTNLGRAETLRREIIEAHTLGAPLAGASWSDLPMNEDGQGWSLELPLAEVSYFKAKAYLLDPKGWQHWPEGPDVGISVHPDAYRTANTIYCAFPRMFGESRAALSTQNPKLDSQIAQIEQHGYTIIPPSGKLRDLIQCLPHILDTLGCRILHLLPVNPTPTTYARFGRFGSPYAALDLTAIDPALVVFDKRTTGVDQFRELTFATHLRGGRVFLDIVINHTGWGSTLQEHHPQWFLRDVTGSFVSPGAWGTTWEDLVELKHDNVVLCDRLAEMFLTWCRRGVDGFRCDAGYKVPVPAWQYIVARVQEEFPQTIFLLEGLGGPLETTEALLTDGGMQWAYSELFQNYSGAEIARYLDYAAHQSRRVGLYVHYSETHDNDRLAAKGRAWSLLRNRLCALASVSGGFGFTAGVEWLAAEKIKVHGSTGMAWDNRDNLVPVLARLNQLLAGHPCFFDGAKLTRLSAENSPVLALRRDSAEGSDTVLVLVNPDPEKPGTLDFAPSGLRIPDFKFELLGQTPPEVKSSPAGPAQIIVLPPGSVYCLAQSPEPRGLNGDAYRRMRAQSAWGLQALSHEFGPHEIGPCDWRKLAELVERSPFDFLAASQRLDRPALAADVITALETALRGKDYPRVVRWSPADRSRITPVPPGHWLLIEDNVRFRASLQDGPDDRPWNVECISVRKGYIACIPPRICAADATLRLERYAATNPHVDAVIRFLADRPKLLADWNSAGGPPPPDALVLLTNGIGGMARLGVDLGRVQSKYDCVLAANLHSSVPVDRHVFVKRMRAWVNAGGFTSPLDMQNLSLFSESPLQWHFNVKAGDGRWVSVQLEATMVPGRNAVAFRFSALRGYRGGVRKGALLFFPDLDVRLTVRFDIEDRNFHTETHRNGGAEHHFSTHTRTLSDGIGFTFTPAADRRLYVFCDRGVYHSAPEWCDRIPHPRDQSRGQVGSGDAFSPGWFEWEMPDEAAAQFIVSAATEEFESHGTGITQAANDAFAAAKVNYQRGLQEVRQPDFDCFGKQLIDASRAFLVRRDSGKTVIAGYPWFLDWGRDTFICTRGLLAAGMEEDVKEILLTFARFEKDGTLPNIIHGEDASNRDTSDAPLWFGMACEELAAARPDLYSMTVGSQGRSIREVLRSIAGHYLQGTPNGIRVDAESGLVWSPSHFTWMDTNYPAGTPREGYPVEIQALWIRLLRQLERIDETAERKKWAKVAEQALASLEKLFWLETQGYYADLLIAKPRQSAVSGTASDALRSNALFPVSLGLVQGERAQRCVAAATRHLVVPGALRSLAPLPVSVPLPVCTNDGPLLNNPIEPYWGRYEGDEDTRRKPAYHNGTAWTWTFPVFCEALARAWDFSPDAIAAARAYLGSADRLIAEGCIGQVPEVLDGDAPHQQRGCDAQAWGVTEALRVWKLLERPRPA